MMEYLSSKENAADYDMYNSQDRALGYWYQDIPYILHIDKKKKLVVGRSYFTFKFPPTSSDNSCKQLLDSYFNQAPAHIYGDNKLFQNGDRFLLPPHLLREPMINFMTIEELSQRKDAGNIQKDYRRAASIKLVDIPQNISPPAQPKNDINYGIFFLIYLAKKYKDVCVVMPKKLKPYDVTAVYLNIFIFQKDFSQSSTNRGLVKETKECLQDKSTRFVVTFVAWQYKFNDQAHANVLIFDKKTKEIYLFDPWGEHEYEQNIEEIIKELINNHLVAETKGYTLHFPPQYCPKNIFQKLEGKEKLKFDYAGYCGMWTYFIVEQMLLNPNVPLPELIVRTQQKLLAETAPQSLAIAKHESDFKAFIRRYTRYYERIVEKGLKDINYKRKSKQILSPGFVKKYEAL